jgi:hypothetical protein
MHRSGAGVNDRLGRGDSWSSGRRTKDLGSSRADPARRRAGGRSGVRGRGVWRARAHRSACRCAKNLRRPRGNCCRRISSRSRPLWVGRASGVRRRGCARRDWWDLVLRSGTGAGCAEYLGSAGTSRGGSRRGWDGWASKNLCQVAGCRWGRRRRRGRRPSENLWPVATWRGRRGSGRYRRAAEDLCPAAGGRSGRRRSVAAKDLRPARGGSGRRRRRWSLAAKDLRPALGRRGRQGMGCPEGRRWRGTSCWIPSRRHSPENLCACGRR